MNKSKFDLQNTKHKIPNTNHGITLVALIITVIVLLILAMVSIRLVMNGGIIGRAEKSTKAYSEEEVGEQIKLAYSEWQMHQYTNETQKTAQEFMQEKLRDTLKDNELTVTETEGVFTVTLKRGKQFTYTLSTGIASKVKMPSEYSEIIPNVVAKENSRYISDGKVAIIPEGYRVSEVIAEQNIDTGLVIKEASNDENEIVNEWVWIPVDNEDFNNMFVEANDEGWNMYNTEVKTKYKSRGNIISNYPTRGNPGTTGKREPDVVKDDMRTSQIGKNITETATIFKDDYKCMLDSIKKYGGFYIGRYELSSLGTKKNQTQYKSTKWYNLYNKCKQFGNNSTVSGMIWGCQWDETCKFISTLGDKINFNDSKKFGNSYDAIEPAISGNYEKGKLKNTGSNDKWKINNIYDLFGNCEEWTQGAQNENSRECRGSSYGSSYGTVCTVSTASPSNSLNDNTSSRPVLYIK